MTRRMWTTNEIDIVRKRRAEGASFLTISCEVDHSVNSCIKIANKYFILKPKKPVVQKPEIQTGSDDIKICTYQSCRDSFERPPGTPQGTWDQMSRCPKCRIRANKKKGIRQIEPTLGRYEIKSEIIDRFLYGIC